MDEPDLKTVNALTGNCTKFFKCLECGTAFSQKCHLRAHERIHSGEKPFKCEECGASFAEKGNLGRHLRIHANDKPYICQVCGDSFSHMGSLSRHRRRKHKIQKQFRCNLCGCTLAQFAGLELHMRIKHDVTSDGPLMCPICGISFAQSVDMVTHSCSVCVESELQQSENEHRICEVCIKNPVLSTNESESDKTENERDDTTIVKRADFVKQALKNKFQQNGVLTRTCVGLLTQPHLCRNSEHKTKSDVSDMENSSVDMELRNVLCVGNSADARRSKLNTLDFAQANQKSCTILDKCITEMRTREANLADLLLSDDGSDTVVELAKHSDLVENPKNGKILARNTLDTVSSERNSLTDENATLKLENIELKSENCWLKLEIQRLKLENKRLQNVRNNQPSKADGSRV